MTYIKTTKTILFASLIAALILPFSMMDTAKAEHNSQPGDYWRSHFYLDEVHRGCDGIDYAWSVHGLVHAGSPNEFKIINDFPNKISVQKANGDCKMVKYDAKKVNMWLVKTPDSIDCSLNKNKGPHATYIDRCYADNLTGGPVLMKVSVTYGPITMIDMTYFLIWHL